MYVIVNTIHVGMSMILTNQRSLQDSVSQFLQLTQDEDSSYFMISCVSRLLYSVRLSRPTARCLGWARILVWKRPLYIFPNNPRVCKTLTLSLNTLKIDNPVPKLNNWEINDLEFQYSHRTCISYHHSTLFYYSGHLLSVFFLFVLANGKLWY